MSFLLLQTVNSYTNIFFPFPNLLSAAFPVWFIGNITNFSSLSWVFNNKYTVSAKGDTFFFFEIGSYYPGSQDPPHMCCDTCAPPDRQTHKHINKMSTST